MTDAEQQKSGAKRRATAILAAGIASLVVFPLAVLLAPVTWVLAYRFRAARNDQAGRKRWTTGVALAGLGLAAFVVLVALVPSSKTPSISEQARSKLPSITEHGAVPATSATKPPVVTSPPTVSTPATTGTTPPTSTQRPTATTKAMRPAKTTTESSRPAGTTSVAQRPTRTTKAAAPKPPPVAPRTTKSKPATDPALVAQRFYLRTDDDAIALDDAIGAQLDGADKVATIERIRKRILNRVNDRLLSGGDQSIAANLLISAGAQARDAAREGDLPRLVDARRDIATARGRLASELRG